MISSKRPIVVYIEQARIPDETTSITRSEVPITGVFRERVTVGPGDTIPLAPHQDLVHLFDAETGKRL